MSAIKKVQAYLDSLGTGLKIKELNTDTSTAELAAQALGLEVGQIAKSLLFRSKIGYFMVVSAGDVRMDQKRLKELIGGKARMASPEEVLEITGYPVGGVCPFLMPNPIPLYLDDSLLRYDVVYAAAGTANSALPIGYEQLMQITGGQPCSVSER
ncbi:MAG: YbaK/EbsC family protein [Chitinophagales bacterium]